MQVDSGGSWTRVGAVLILLAGVLHLVLAIAAIGGAEGLEANVMEIEANAGFGDLYFALATWGWVTLALGLAEIVAATSLWRGTRNGRLAGLIVAYGGLTGAFFTLSIFRVGSVAAIVLLLSAVYLLSYHSGPRA